MSSEESQLCALLDAVRALDDSAASYALIGGLAVGVHSGVPRATNDVDLAITSGESHIVSVLIGAGFELTGEHAHSLNFRHRSGQPLQLAFDLDFDVMIARAEVTRVADVDIRIERAKRYAIKPMSTEEPRLTQMRDGV